MLACSKHAEIIEQLVGMPSAAATRQSEHLSIREALRFDDDIDSATYVHTTKRRLQPWQRLVQLWRRCSELMRELQ